MSSILGFVLAFCASFFKAGKSITTKIVASGFNEYIASWATRTVSIFVFLAGVIILNELFIPNEEIFWLSLLINSVLLSVSTILFAKALKLSDISIISPLMALLPVFVAVGSFIILNEIPTLQGGAGLILVTVGAYILNVNDGLNDIMEPFKRLITDKGAQYVFAGLIVSAIIPSVDKIGITLSTPLLWVLATHIGSTLIITLIIYSKGINISSPVKTSYKILILLGLFNAGIWIFQSYAYVMTQVAYVQAIKRVSILLSIIAGAYYFNEKYVTTRLIGGVLMIIGISFIIIAG